MLFDSSLRKELARSFGATLVVLVTVVMTMTLIRTVGEASRGTFNPTDVMIIMGYTVLSDMPTILSLSLFIAILSVLTRMYKDSEMVIWFASGRGLTAFVRPMLRFSWPILLVIAALAFLILPWAYGRIEDLRDRFEKRGDIARVEPGQFQESANGERVFFIEKQSDARQTGNNVFIAAQERGKETITSAKSGRVESQGGDRYLILENGQRLEKKLGQQSLTVSYFEKYGARVGTDDTSDRAYVPTGSLNSLQLLREPTPINLAELSWRAGLALAAFNFVIIGIAASGVNPRVGRTANLGFAFLTFVVYFNFLVLGKSWIESGRVSFGLLLLGLHGTALALGLLWLSIRHSGWQLRLVRRKRVGEAGPMKTVRRLLYREVVLSVSMVTLGFIALFVFFDLVDELQSINRAGSMAYQLPQALIYVLLMVPSHIYELIPITVLIGTIFVMARLAQSSEFTILRTSGLGPWRALRILTLLGLMFVVFTFAIGDYVSPLADRTAQMLKSKLQGQIKVGRTGAWLKEKQAYSNYAVNVGALLPDGNMKDIRIYEFDNQGHLISMTQADSGSFGEHDDWQLEGVERTEFQPLSTDTGRADRASLAQFRWPTLVSAEMVAAAVLRPERMGTLDLFQYMRHLTANGQSAQKYEIQFWKKVFYPLSCLVMVVLALPFAYFHFRSGGIATYVFAGVMAGISFVLLNNVLSDLGNLRGWQPWLTAAAPGLIYSLLSLSAFGWLVLRR